MITLAGQVTASGKASPMTGQNDMTTVAAASRWQVSGTQQAGAGSQ